MRRSTLLSVLGGALVGFAVVAAFSMAAGSSSSSSSAGSAPASAGGGGGSFRQAYARRGGQRAPRARGHRRHGGRRHGGPGFGPLGIAFKGLAGKLDVTPAKLREAVQGVKKRALDRAVADGTITQEERDSIDACVKRRGGAGCDRAKAFAAHRKVHKALQAKAKSDAAGLKAQLIDDLAAELGKQPADVDTAVRSQLSDTLGLAVTMGFVTDHGRDLALGCYDKPNECDRAALRAEVKKRFRGRGPGPGHHGPGHP